MKCYQPILIHTVNKLTGQEYDLLVPCRKCIACKEAIAQEFTVRYLHEVKDKYKRLDFLTLTYKNEDIIEKYQVEPKHITNYIKRVREYLRRYDKRHGTALNDFKYFLSAEYGDETQRPHYHLILSCNDKKVRDKFITDWENHYGHVDVKEGDIRSIYYTIGYVNKKIGTNNKKKTNMRQKEIKHLGSLQKDWVNHTQLRMRNN